MYQMISPTQIKAARAMLDWSQGDLAGATGLSLTTIRSLEMGFMPRNVTLQKIRQTIEDRGLQLTDSEGIKRRIVQLKIFQGRNGCDQLFDDILQVVKQKECEVSALFKTNEIMQNICGVAGNSKGHLEALCKLTMMKCLVPESLDPSLLSSTFQYRIIPKQLIGAISYFIYADQHALVLPEGNATYRFMVFSINELAQSYNNEFVALWNNAIPVV